MPRTSLQDVRALPDPLLTYQWDVIIPTMPGTPNSRSLTFKALSAVIPGSMIEQVPVNLGAVEVRYAGRENNSHAFPMTIHETRDVGTRDMLLRWKKTARDNQNNTGNYKSVYSTSVELALYDDTNAVTRRIRLIGAWIETLDDAPLDRNSAAVSISCTLSYDDFEELEA
jgi:hypothetical protein